MVDATRAIADGSFAGDLVVAASTGELAQLGDAMNEMHRQLEARQRQFRDIAQISSDWFWGARPRRPFHLLLGALRAGDRVPRRRHHRPQPGGA
ncbi:MAG: HAMP domain-containing protein [Aliidongia sp.]